MLYLLLFFALLMMGGAHYAARREPHPVRWVGFLTCGAIATVFLGSEVLAETFGLLVVALVVWRFARHRLRTFLPLSVVAVAIPFGIAGQGALKERATHTQLRQEYPLESLAGRVPEPRADLRTPPTSAAASRLDWFEEAVQIKANQTLRASQLQRLHERNVSAFVERPGFGLIRTIPERRLTARSLGELADRGETPAQPGSPAVWGSGEAFESPPTADREQLVGLHADGMMDFVNPQGWGYVKDRTRVAGFLSHRFSKVPEAQTWRVQRIELVGLLKHPEPVVYLSDRLPAMAELQTAPTRPLDAFESAGLDAVRKGEDGFAARRGEVVRFVGGIRSAKQCVECHGGARGDLLGAFAYTLRPSGDRP